MMAPINDQLMAAVDVCCAVSARIANTVKCVACAVIVCFAWFTSTCSLYQNPAAVDA